jgi:FKBP-type peptidyl-prolyl cis-trans isomerase SlyD
MTKNVMAIEYSLVDANTKEELDSNVGGPALEFITGTGQIIPGLENELIKLDIGAKTDVLVQPADGYGEFLEEAIQVLPKEQFAGVELQEGMTLYGSSEDGQTMQVVVKSFNDEEVTIDSNHPMAGKTLLFSVEILSIREATQEEIQTGAVGGLAAMGGGCGCGDQSCDSDDIVENDSCCSSGNC